MDDQILIIFGPNTADITDHQMTRLQPAASLVIDIPKQSHKLVAA